MVVNGSDMKTIWSLIARTGSQPIHRNPPDVEDDEMLFSKNNVCVHPVGPASRSPGAEVPHHSLGYLTVTAQPDPVLGHTLLLSWRPNQLMARSGGRAWPRSISETSASALCNGLGGDVGVCGFRPCDGGVTPDRPRPCDGDVTAARQPEAGRDEAGRGDAAAVTPSAVSPSAVSPSAVSPSAVSPSAVSPSAVSLPAVSPSVSQSSVSPSAISPSAVSPSAVSQSAVSPSAIFPPAVSPSAVSQSAVSLSAVSSSAISPSAVSQSAVSSSAISPSAVSQSAVSSSAVSPSAVSQSAVSQSAVSLSAVSSSAVSSSAVSSALAGPEPERRRLATQSAPSSPGPRAPAAVPAVFSADIGRARSVRVFLSPHEPGCGQLVVCSRQSQYRILHFHHGGLDRLVRLFERWRHLLGGGGPADGGCLIFSVCSPALEEGEEHPEEGQHPRLTPELWRELAEPDGRLPEPDELRKAVFFGGLDPALRPVVWPLLLGVDPFDASKQERATRRQRRHEEFDRISGLPELLTGAARDDFQRLVASTVDKDVVRTDPANPFFCGRANPNVRTLRRILLGFAVENPSLGYTQGMSDLLAPLLVTLERPADAYWALDALLKRSAAVIGPRDDVMDGQLMCLRELLRLMVPELYHHLASVEDGLELLFAHRWLLLCFKREFAEETALTVWETCWSCPVTRHFCLFVCAAVCSAYARDVIDLKMSADAALLHFSSLSQHMDGRLILRKARGLLHRFLSLESVPCTLASLCSAPEGGPWDSYRVTSIHCRGHVAGQPCPAVTTR